MTIEISQIKKQNKIWNVSWYTQRGYQKEKRELGVKILKKWDKKTDENSIPTDSRSSMKLKSNKRLSLKWEWNFTKLKKKKKIP